MRFLVATRLTQGQRKNDFCFAKEDELVRFGTECDGEKVDGACGCRRSMIGMESSKGTTTMKVVDLDLSRGDLFKRMNQSFIKSGWGAIVDDKLVAQDVDEIIRIAEFFPLGSVIEKRGSHYGARKLNK